MVATTLSGMSRSVVWLGCWRKSEIVCAQYSAVQSLALFAVASRPVIMLGTLVGICVAKLYTIKRACTQTTLRELEAAVSTVAHSLEDVKSVGCNVLC